MPDKPGILFQNIGKRGINSPKRDFAIFIFFLLLSFGFWYLNSLRKDFEIDLKYPVRYINPPKGKSLPSDIPSKITINLKGSGYSIFKLRISGNRLPLVIDFSKVTYKRVPGNKSTDIYIVSNTLVANFNRQFSPEFQIISVKPDTLFINFQNKPGNGASGNKSTRPN